MKLYAPNGKEITGTLEILYGRGNILNDSVTREPNGDYAFEWEGSTTVFWEGQRTVERRARRIFLDEEGGEYPEHKLVLK